MNKFFTLLSNHERKVEIVFVIYTLICAVLIGISWDEIYYHKLGKINLNYLLSFGSINEDFYSKYRYSTLYWSFSSLLTQLAPQTFNLEFHHIINSIFGLLTVVAVYKITKKLFNTVIAKFATIFLLLLPFFFGHFAINNKDIIITFSHFWIIYYLIKYATKKLIGLKRIIIVLKISILSAIGTGIQLMFFGSLLPIVLIFFTYLILNKIKSLKVVLLDLLMYATLFYLILVLFWPDTHENIFILPFKFLIQTFSIEVGWPFNLLNGTYISSKEVPINYLLVNYLYKLPEYVLFLYFISGPLIFFNFKNLSKKIQKIKLKILTLFILLVYPNLILYFISYPIYDGLRLFLWVSPYIVIIPAITAYLLFEKKKEFYVLTKYIILFLFIYHIYNFFLITPYHYTYLNYLSGDEKERYKKFENDYWSVSLKELILTSNLNAEKIKFHTCGINADIAKTYMKKRYKNSEYADLNSAAYIIMTNRTVLSRKKNQITNCYDEYSLENVHQVKRNGIILSAIKKINNE